MAAVGIFALTTLSYRAQAITFGVQNITHNGPENIASQFSIDVTQTPAQAAAGQVQFMISNNGPVASSIAGIYFDDGTLLSMMSPVSLSGVLFKSGGSPSNLPGGSAIGFETSADAQGNGFYATIGTTSTKGKGKGNGGGAPTDLGVNPGEQVGIVFALKSEGGGYMDLSDTLSAMVDGNLRIGLHVRAIGQDGYSDSFVTQVTDGGLTAMLLGFVLLGVEGLRRKFRK